ncbi:MAG: hypothetical protein MKZ70_03715, partial [Opitutales bacterium]|nr:hypothetical protein [Opitutales bacterium]
NRKGSSGDKGVGSTGEMGTCQSYTTSSPCVSLLKILLTNVCLYECQYCINRRSSNGAKTLSSPFRNDWADTRVEIDGIPLLQESPYKRRSDHPKRPGSNDQVQVCWPSKVPLRDFQQRDQHSMS